MSVVFFQLELDFQVTPTLEEGKYYLHSYSHTGCCLWVISDPQVKTIESVTDSERHKQTEKIM